MDAIDRRAALAAFGALGLGALASACTKGPAPSGSPSGAQAACVLAPELTQGPYFIPGDLVRSDITEGTPGTPLALVITVVDAATCMPIKDAAVDIWHADASGVYSGYGAASTGADAPSPGAPGPGPGPGGPPAGGGQLQAPTDDLRFLRGIQMTDSSGVSRFQTIYPGWYRGRAVHIHLKVFMGAEEAHTGQLFFDDDLTDKVHEAAAYRGRGPRDTRNAADGLFSAAGAAALLAVQPSDGGYTASVTVGVRTV
jgi:protocatechuate 3,4-dioxygenase beta subunit